MRHLTTCSLKMCSPHIIQSNCVFVDKGAARFTTAILASSAQISKKKKKKALSSVIVLHVSSSTPTYEQMWMCVLNLCVPNVCPLVKVGFHSHQSLCVFVHLLCLCLSGSACLGEHPHACDDACVG